jgi:hypothetical protein
MKIFILIAIIFFSWRVFAEDYYYEGRYNKIEDYIRFQEDPGYQAFLNEKRAEARNQRVGVESYFEEKDKEAAIQEKNRQAHLIELANRPAEEDTSKLEAAYEREKALEQKAMEKERLMHLAQMDLEKSKARPARMIASVFEGDQEAPVKRVPRENRKYKPKPKSPIEAARARK